MACSLNTIKLLTTSSRVSHHLKGISPLRPPLPDKAIKATFFLVVVQSSSCVQLFVTPWTAARHSSLSLTISQSLPKFMFMALAMPSSHLILWFPLLLLPSIFPRIKDFSNESSVCIRWPKFWSFSFSIIPCSEYSGYVSFKIDWFDWLFPISKDWLFSTSPKTLSLHFYLALVNRGGVQAIASADLCVRPVLPCKPGSLMPPRGNHSLNFLTTKGKDG